MTPGWFPCLSFQSRQFINDVAKIYSIMVTNAVDGVASSCRACALGSERSGSSCVPCPPGHFIEQETSQCKECPANTFLSIHQVYGREACIPCGPGSRSTKVLSVSGPWAGSVYWAGSSQRAAFSAFHVPCEHWSIAITNKPTKDVTSLISVCK